MKSFKDYLAEEEHAYNNPVVGDAFAFEIREEQLIESVVCDLHEDGIVIDIDETAMAILESYGLLEQGQPGAHAVDSISPIHSNANQDRREDDLEEGAEVTYYVTVEKPGTEVIEIRALGPYDAKEKAEQQGYRVIDVKDQYDLDEAKYQGREVPLGKPMAGDVAKSKVYVRDPKTGNVKKVNFGDPNMKIKKSNPARRKSFRARHNCDNPGPRTKARYWSCRAW
jgi:hypothetical protein